MISIGRLADGIGEAMQVDQVTARVFATRLVLQGWLPRGTGILSAPATPRAAACLLMCMMVARHSQEIDAVMAGISRMKAVSCLELPMVDGEVVDIERPLVEVFPKAVNALLLPDLEQLIAAMVTGETGDWSHRPAWFGWTRHEGRLLFWLFAETEGGPDLGIVYSDTPAIETTTRGRILGDTVRTERGAVLGQVAALLRPTLPSQGQMTEQEGEDDLLDSCP